MITTRSKLFFVTERVYLWLDDDDDEDDTSAKIKSLVMRIE